MAQLLTGQNVELANRMIGEALAGAGGPDAMKRARLAFDVLGFGLDLVRFESYEQQRAMVEPKPEPPATDATEPTQAAPSPEQAASEERARIIAALQEQQAKQQAQAIYTFLAQNPPSPRVDAILQGSRPTSELGKINEAVDRLYMKSWDFMTHLATDQRGLIGDEELVVSGVRYRFLAAPDDARGNAAIRWMLQTPETWVPENGYVLGGFGCQVEVARRDENRVAIVGYPVNRRELAWRTTCSPFTREVQRNVLRAFQAAFEKVE